MAKAKTAGEKINGATETIESAFKNGSEALKANFEKATKGYEQILGFSKDTAEAYVKAANVAGKGAETLHNEIVRIRRLDLENRTQTISIYFSDCYRTSLLKFERKQFFLTIASDSG